MIRYARALMFVVLLTGCAKKAAVQTPAANVTSPQLKVLQLTQLGAASAHAAAQTWDVLCHSVDGKAPSTVDPETCDGISKYLTISANAFTAIAIEVATNEPWPAMRIRLAEIGAATATDATVVDPQLKMQVDSLRRLIAQILEVQ